MGGGPCVRHTSVRIASDNIDTRLKQVLQHLLLQVVIHGVMLLCIAGLCNAGYFCVEGSSSASSELCPTGHFCPQGTAVPERCPEVSWC